jgi:transmembrane sensor
MTASGPAVPSNSYDAVSRRAADYCQRRHFWEWRDSDQAELDAWFAESILHRVAYLRLEGAVAHAERLVTSRAPEPGPQFNPTAPGGNGKIVYRRFMLPLLIAASVALIAALGIPFVHSLMQPPDRTYSTDVGGRTLLKFADGTEIELDTDTVVNYRMTTQERTVWLERGKAWFHVSHDAANPFTVIVGRHRVTDLGTEFLVRRGSDAMEVALLSGRAALSTEGAQTAMLNPGDDAIATPVSMSVTRKTPQELADALSWRRGVLVFRNTRFADVVREFNRYNATRLVIADPSVADMKFSAELKTDQFEGFLQLAQTVLNLRVDREGNDVLLFRSSGQKPKKTVHAKHDE